MMGSGGAWAGPKGSAGCITAPGAAHWTCACGRGLAGAPPHSRMPLPAGVAAGRGGRKQFLQPPASDPPSAGSEGSRKPPAAGLSPHKADSYDRRETRRRAVNGSNNRRLLVAWRPVTGVYDYLLASKRRQQECGSRQVGAASSAGCRGVSRMLHAAKGVRRGAACLAPVSRKAGRGVPCGAKAARGISAYGTATLATMRPIRRPGRVRATAQSAKRNTAAGGQSMPGMGPTPGRERRPRARGTRSFKGGDAWSGAVHMV